jgi:hypothetical protein
MGAASGAAHLWWMKNGRPACSAGRSSSYAGLFTSQMGGIVPLVHVLHDYSKVGTTDAAVGRLREKLAVERCGSAVGRSCHTLHQRQGHAASLRFAPVLALPSVVP